MLNALDVKQDIDYVYRVYFERFIDCQDRLAILLDEREQERYYLSQIAQTIDLKTISRQRLAVYWQILQNIVTVEINNIRQLRQLIKRG